MTDRNLRRVMRIGGSAVTALIVVAGCGGTDSTSSLQDSADALDVVIAREEISEQLDELADASEAEANSTEIKAEMVAEKLDATMAETESIDEAVMETSEMIEKIDEVLSADDLSSDQREELETERENESAKLEVLEQDLEDAAAEAEDLSAQRESLEAEAEAARNDSEAEKEAADVAKAEAEKAKEQYEEECGDDEESMTATTVEKATVDDSNDDGEDRDECVDVTLIRVDTHTAGLSVLCGSIGGPSGPSDEPVGVHLAAFDFGGAIDGILGGCGKGGGPASLEELIAYIEAIPGAELSMQGPDQFVFVLPASAQPADFVERLSATGPTTWVDSIKAVDDAFTAGGYLASEPEFALAGFEPDAIAEYADIIATLPAPTVLTAPLAVITELPSESLPAATAEELVALPMLTVQHLPVDYLRDVDLAEADLAVLLTGKQKVELGLPAVTIVDGEFELIDPTTDLLTDPDLVPGDAADGEIGVGDG